MTSTNVAASDRPTPDLLDGTAARVVPPRSVGIGGDTYRFAGFLQFTDGDDCCWFRRTIRVDPPASGDHLDLSVTEEYRDAALGRIVRVTSYADSCPWDGDGSFESIQRAVTEWHEAHRTLAPSALAESERSLPEQRIERT